MGHYLLCYPRIFLDYKIRRSKYIVKCCCIFTSSLLVHMLKKCSCCDTETLNPKFCSRSCAAKINNSLKPKKEKELKKCKHCENLVHQERSLLCAYHFAQHQPEYIENFTLQEFCDREKVKKGHPSNKFCHVRYHAKSHHKDLKNLPCHTCGYDKHVELCHIKAISSFPVTATVAEVNHFSNIVQLCPNCHWEFDKGHLLLTNVKNGHMG